MLALFDDDDYFLQPSRLSLIFAISRFKRLMAPCYSYIFTPLPSKKRAAELAGRRHEIFATPLAALAGQRAHFAATYACPCS